MPGNYPEESIQQSEHGGSLKSRTKITGLSLVGCWTQYDWPQFWNILRFVSDLSTQLAPVHWYCT